MKIYQKTTKFNSNTGEPYSTWKFKELRCDFSGNVIDIDEDGCSYPNYILQYEEEDPCFGSDGDEYDFGEKYDISMHEFLSDEYNFLFNSYNGYNACNIMIKHYINDYPSRDFDFARMCRVSRIKTAIKLIEDGIVTAEQLCEN